MKVKTKNTWDEAIADAKRKIRELEFAIAIFRRRKKAGDLWPAREPKVFVQND